MATKKKSGIKGAGVKTSKADAAAKRKALNEIHKKKAKGTGNPALDRANAVAKKGKKATPKGAKTKLLKAVDKAVTPAVVKKGPKALVKAIEGAIDKAGKPQFFGRPKVKKEVDPLKAAAERRDNHTAMMRVPWYAAYRKNSIEQWIERRKAIAANDTALVEKINRKLDKIGKERDEARAEWKAAGSVVPGEVAKPEKPAKVAKPKKAKPPSPAPAQVGDQRETVEGGERVDVGGGIGMTYGQTGGE